MKDLDIRGAGNMLGGEQSGFISEIGFEMYQKILNEAMEELKDNEFKELFEERNTDSPLQYVRDCMLETDLEARIPDDYVNNVAERLSLYQEMDNLKNEEELQEFANRLKDRFGPLPRQVQELIISFRLRWLAQKMGLERLVIKSNKMIGYFIADPQSPFYETEIFTQVLNHIQRNARGCKLSEKNDRLRIIFDEVKHIRDAYEQIFAICG